VFIQVIQGHTSDPDRLRRQFERWLEELAPEATGWLGATFGVTEEGTAISVVRFESQEAAQANSSRPEQGSWWAETEKCYDSGVTFHDCAQVQQIWGGGSDEAGFVQVIQGRMLEPNALQSFVNAMEATGRHRLDVIGGTFAFHEDGKGFTETIYFTNERDARQAEAEMNQRTDEVADEMRMFGENTTDVGYLDLRDPWLVSQ
jgi:hypothetical protein